MNERFKKVQVYVILLFVLLIKISFCGCINNDETEYFMGVSLSPKSYQENDFLDFFEKSKQTGNMVMWAGDWIFLNNTNDGAPRVVANFASMYGYTPLIIVTYFDQSTGELVRPLDEQTKQVYKNSAVEFCREFNLQFFGMGIEVNSFYEKSPDKYNEFVEFYNEVYDAIKQVSPDTMIFTVFQIEKMKGFTLWLEDSYQSENEQWYLLEDFLKLDVFAFTTYPCLIFKDPNDIPNNYYSDIQNFTSKNIAVTESGWHSNNSPEGWESSEAEQAEFISTFFNLIEPLDYKILIWSFMYDQDTIEPFNSMGLRNNIDGSSRLSWNIWVNYYTRVSIDNIS